MSPTMAAHKEEDEEGEEEQPNPSSAPQEEEATSASAGAPSSLVRRCHEVESEQSIDVPHEYLPSLCILI